MDNKPIPTGIRGLDRLFRGGLRPGTLTLLVGGFATGKTTFGLQYLLANARAGLPGIFISLEGPPDQLVISHQESEAGLKRYTRRGTLSARFLPLGTAESGPELRKLMVLIARKGIKCAFIDGFHHSRRKQVENILELSGLLREAGVTSILSYGQPREAKDLSTEGDYLAARTHTVFRLSRTGSGASLKLALHTDKMAGSKPLSSLSYRITDQGIKLLSPPTPPARTRDMAVIFCPISILQNKWEQVFKNLISRIKKKYPRLEFSILKGSSRQLGPHLSTKESDIALTLVPLNYIPEFGRQELLLDLGPVGPSIDRAGLVDQALAACRYEDRLLALPRYLDTRVYLYNSSLLKKYGFGPPRTWGEMADQAGYILKAENDPALVGLLTDQHFYLISLAYMFIEYHQACGGQFFQGRGIDPPTGKKALRFLKDLAVKHRALSYDTFQSPYADPYRAFYEGKSVFFYSSLDAWQYPGTVGLSSGFRPGMVLLPADPGPGSLTFFLFGTALAVPANSRHQEIGLELVRYLADRKTTGRICRRAGFSIAGNVYKGYNKGQVPGVPDISGALPHCCPASVMDPYYNDVSTYITMALRHVLIDGQDPDSVIRRLNDNLRLYLRRYQYSDAVRRAVSYIQAHYNSRLTLDEIATHVSLSPTHLKRLFKVNTGTSCVDYIIRLRLARAVDLLENTSYTISEIARQVGYDDPYYFSRLFKKKHSVSPLHYRSR
jgi:AraC-like DNA-binding protein/ABC-type glycerol-3-phosphate transport system substrate-binding protein